MNYLHCDVGPIETLVLKHARDAFVSDQSIDRQWNRLNYTSRPDFALAVDEYDRFVDMLRGFGIEILFLPQDDAVGLDSIYVRDASVVCGRGMILCNMGKPERSGEPAALESAVRHLDVDIAGRIQGEGRLEGGDVVWLDDSTLAVGRGYRTNDEGIRQLQALVGDVVSELIVVPLPHWRGPDDVFHLMSVLSPIDRDLALVYSPLLPVPFREALLSRGFHLVEVPDDEFATMGCNVLAVAPRKCVMLSDNPTTRRLLEVAGADVHVFEGNEISVKGAGGPTCLTRPISVARD